MRIAKIVARLGGVFQMRSGLQSVVHCASIGGAAALMAFAPAAHAVPTLSTASNIVVPATTAGVYINLLTGVTGITPAAVPGWDINPWGSTNLSFFNPPSPTGGVYVGTATVPASLPLGTVIGAASTFGSGASTAFTLNATNYFGFRFLNEGNGQIHYGYGTMIVGSTITTRTVGQLFFESTPGAAITVAIPEPSTYALMLLGGLGVAGVAARRRRQAAA